jgi:hypothetical protein
MKHYLSCLVFLSVFLLGPGCGEPGDDPVTDAGQMPPSDGAQPQPVPPDANPNSYINPPLTPDDPCRQLKRTFVGDVFSADIAIAGTTMVVVYAAASGAGVLVYEGETLINEQQLGDVAAPRVLNFDGKVVVAAVGSASNARITLNEVDPTGTLSSSPLPVPDRQDGALFDVLGERAPNGDTIYAISSVFRENQNSIHQIGDGVPRGGGVAELNPDAISVQAWPAPTVVDGIDVYTMADAAAGVDNTGVRRIKVRTANYVTSSGDMNIRTHDAAAILNGTGEVTNMSHVLVTPTRVVAAVEREEAGARRVEYYQLEIPSADGVSISTTAGAELAARGTALGDPLAATPRAPWFVERHIGEDGMSAAWHLFDPLSGATAAVGRVGFAGRQAAPGALKQYGRRVVWAGPTIRDGFTSDYPADAIAVCSVQVQ